MAGIVIETRKQSSSNCRELGGGTEELMRVEWWRLIVSTGLLGAK